MKSNPKCQGPTQRGPTQKRTRGERPYHDQGDSLVWTGPQWTDPWPVAYKQTSDSDATSLLRCVVELLSATVEKAL